MSKEIKDNYLISKGVPRTTDSLFIKGLAIATEISKEKTVQETTDIPIPSLREKFYTKAEMYLQAAAVLGHKEAPFPLSLIYNEGAEAMKNEKLSEMWLAVGCELGEKRALEAASPSKRNMIFDENTQLIAQHYANFMKETITTNGYEELISLKSIDAAITRWNAVEDRSDILHLTSHTIELAGDCGALDDGSTNYCCAIL